MNKMLSWFAANSVVANLLMVMIVAAGMLTIPTITKEVFPEFNLDLISVSVRYLGAAPEEVEEGVTVRVEEAIQDIEGIKRINSTASEGVGTIMVELEEGTNTRELLNDIKARVDAIDTFPVETEKPVISEVTNRRQVIDIAVAGEVDEATLKALGQRVRDELTGIDGLSQVQLVSSRPYEVSIEVSEEALRRHNLTFDAVAMAVRRSSLDMPGGAIRSQGGEILLRTKGQAYRGGEFEKLVLFTRPDGTRLLLGDVARVVDGFAETDQSARFSGKPAVGVRVFRVGDQSAIAIADQVKEYVVDAQSRMPAGVTLTTWNDYSRLLQGRMDLMIRSARNGYILVFIILALFMKFRLAFWVSLGIPISFLGAFWLMPAMDVSINLLSLFAFIVVLGIVVDDAIIVGENIFKRHEAGDDGIGGSERGVMEVAMPVIFGVLTTIAAFTPLLFVAGLMGKFMRVIPIIVIWTLVFSLVESLLILPSHLSHVKESKTRRPTRFGLLWRRFQEGFQNRLTQLIERVYNPLLRRAVRYRYATVAIGLSTLALTMGLVGAGWVKFVFFPNVEADSVSAALTLPPGVSAETTSDAMHLLESSALTLRDELAAQVPEGGPGPIQHVFTAVGTQPFRAQQGPPDGGEAFSASNVGEITLELAPSEQRNITSAEIESRWREMTGPIPDAVELVYGGMLDERLAQLLRNAHHRQLDAVELLQVFRRVVAQHPVETRVGRPGFARGRRRVRKRCAARGYHPGVLVERALQRAVRRIGIHAENVCERPLAGVKFHQLPEEIRATGAWQQRAPAPRALRAQIEWTVAQLSARCERTRSRLLRRRLECGRPAGLAQGRQGLDFANPDPQHVLTAGLETPEIAAERVDAQQPVAGDLFFDDVVGALAHLGRQQVTRPQRHFRLVRRLGQRGPGSQEKRDPAAQRDPAAPVLSPPPHAVLRLSPRPMARGAKLTLSRTSAGPTPIRYWTA